MTAGKLLVYLLRRDLRVADNPALHSLAASADHGFTHLLPLYIFPAHQIEVSGFLKEGEKSPYPQARSKIGGFWRCGPHRARFLAQSVWDLGKNLEQLGSGLVIRVGDVKAVLDPIIQELKDKVPAVGAVWMTEELSSEETEEQEAVHALCSANGIDFKLWPDEKYFIDDRDTGLANPKDLPDVFTSYRKTQEPLRKRPRNMLSFPKGFTLPALPSESLIPAQHHPFCAPSNFQDLENRLLRPLDSVLATPPPYPDGAESAHPFQGGESEAKSRLCHLIKSGAMASYKDTRNGLLGRDFSTKLSAYLSLGCLTARQIHAELLKLENGTEAEYEGAHGYGEGENQGTSTVRFELLWRDYMRLCTAKFGRRLFSLTGASRSDKYNKKWKTANKSEAAPNQVPPPEQVAKILERFQAGTTGMGLIDATQRELLHTGYTSNRARQNAASFLAKHLDIDWRYGAEWYEMHLIDYDVSSNWANWQYMAGVGNDPRGDARIFNPVKQAFDYDKDGDYVRTWVPELRGLETPENIFQAWTASAADLEKCGLKDDIMVTDPVKRIDFDVDRKPKGSRRSFPRRRGNKRGGRRGGGNGGGGNGGGGGNSGGNSGGSSQTQGGRATPTEAGFGGLNAQQRHSIGSSIDARLNNLPHHYPTGPEPVGYAAPHVYYNGYAPAQWHAPAAYATGGRPFHDAHRYMPSHPYNPGGPLANNDGFYMYPPISPMGPNLPQ